VFLLNEEEEFEDTKEVIRIRISTKNRYTRKWSHEKVQKDKQRPKKHMHKTKDRVTRTPLKTGGRLGCSGRLRSYSSTSGTCCVDLA
jgi:hypothetical protein